MKWNDASFEKKTWFFFIALFLLIAISPALGRHNNYIAYDDGVRKILSGENPYPADWMTATGNSFPSWFLYGPSFVYLFLPFSSLFAGVHVGTYLWVVMNTMIFYAGVFQAMRFIDTRRLFTGWWLFFCLLLLFNEMQSSLTNLQTNGMVVGLILLGMTSYFRQRFLASAAYLAVATSFKVFPLAAAMLLALEFNPLFIGAFLLFLLLGLAAPLVIIDYGFYVELMKTWIDFLAHDPVHSIYLGMEPTLLKLGIGVDGGLFAKFMLLNAFIIALASFFIFRKGRGEYVRLIIPVLLPFLVLFNKRSESQTFIVVVPVFIIMLSAYLQERASNNVVAAKWRLTALIACWILVSMIYSDLSPRPLRAFAWEWHFKTYGALLIYGWGLKRVADFLFSPALTAHFSKRTARNE